MLELILESPTLGSCMEAELELEEELELHGVETIVDTFSTAMVSAREDEEEEQGPLDDAEERGEDDGAGGGAVGGWTASLSPDEDNVVAVIEGLVESGELRSDMKKRVESFQSFYMFWEVIPGEDDEAYL